MDKVAKDYPDLPKEKYGYEVLDDDEVVRTYAEVLLERTLAFLVVEALASRRTLLSADEVRCCPNDPDDKFEALLAEVAQQMKEDAARKAGEPRAGEETTT